MNMKKQYTAPNILALNIQATNLMSTSVPVSGETDDEARSSKFWGKSIFDEPEEEDIDEGSIF